MNILCAFTGSGDALVPAITGNTWATIQSYLTTAALCGILLSLAAMGLLAAHNLLRDVYVRFMRQNGRGKAILALFVGSAIVCGAVKPGTGTGDPGLGTGEDYAHESDADYEFESGLGRACHSVTAAFLMATLDDGGAHGVSALPSLSLCATATSLVPSPESLVPDMTTITNWTARGAFEDWVTVDLPDGFAFPVGLTNLTRVTIMAYGEIRESLKGGGAHGVSALPSLVSCQPGETVVSYGLTASNTFVVAWSNALSNRVAFTATATNRLNAAIELFPSGAIATTITSDYPSEDPNTYSLVPSPLPVGFYGSGQDEAWIRGNFEALQAYDPSLTNVNQILDVGYSSWLTDAIGYDEPNGFYQVHVTVAALPTDGTPCYLVCGPWKTVISAPGVYSFPLRVFDTYTARTYPERVALSFEYDDGYDYDEDEDTPMLTQTMLTASARTPEEEELEYLIQQIPRLQVTPSSIPLDEAVGRILSIKCNVDGATCTYSPSVSQGVRLAFHGKKEAVIDAAAVECMVEIIYQNPRGRVSGLLSIIRNYIDPSLWPTNELDGSESTNTVSDVSLGSE